MNTRKLSLIAAALVLFSLFTVSAMAAYGDQNGNKGIDCPYNDGDCLNNCDGTCLYEDCQNDCDGTGICDRDCDGPALYGPRYCQ